MQVDVVRCHRSSICCDRKHSLSHCHFQCFRFLVSFWRFRVHFGSAWRTHKMCGNLCKYEIEISNRCEMTWERVGSCQHDECISTCYAFRTSPSFHSLSSHRNRTCVFVVRYDRSVRVCRAGYVYTKKHEEIAVSILVMCRTHFDFFHTKCGRSTVCQWRWWRWSHDRMGKKIAT